MKQNWIRMIIMKRNSPENKRRTNYPGKTKNKPKQKIETKEK